MHRRQRESSFGWKMIWDRGMWKVALELECQRVSRYFRVIRVKE